MSVVVRTTAEPGQGRAQRARQGCLDPVSPSCYSGFQRRRKRCSHARIRSVLHNPTRCVAAPGCTTERHKTHKTDSGQVVYAWHPFYGQEVTIHGERNRRGTVVFACSIGEDPKTASLEVPAWMLDATVCRVFRQGSSGRVTVDALRSLRRTLDRTANVIEAQHQLIAFGGCDAPTNEGSQDTAQAVSSQSSDAAVSSGDTPASGCSPGSTSSAARRSKSNSSGRATGERS
jgi:hypothetical protein